MYRPQRWESGELIKRARPGAGYIDFNGGPRLCLGSEKHLDLFVPVRPANDHLITEDFALTEASYATVKILQAFPNIKLAPGIPNEPVGAERQIYTIGIFPVDGVHVLMGGGSGR